MGTCIYPSSRHGDLKLEWNEENAAEAIAKIQEKMNQGVTFHILDPDSKAKAPPVLEIDNTNQISNRQVYIRDSDIAKLVEDGMASIVSFTGVAQLKTMGKAKTAEEVVENDTVAVAPKAGG